MVFRNTTWSILRRQWIFGFIILCSCPKIFESTKTPETIEGNSNENQWRNILIEDKFKTINGEDKFKTLNGEDNLVKKSKGMADVLRRTKRENPTVLGKINRLFLKTDKMRRGRSFSDEIWSTGRKKKVTQLQAKLESASKCKPKSGKELVKMFVSGLNELYPDTTKILFEELQRVIDSKNKKSAHHGVNRHQNKSTRGRKPSLLPMSVRRGQIEDEVTTKICPGITSTTTTAKTTTSTMCTTARTCSALAPLASTCATMASVPHSTCRGGVASTANSDKLQVHLPQTEIQQLDHDLIRVQEANDIGIQSITTGLTTSGPHSTIKLNKLDSEIERERSLDYTFTEKLKQKSSMEGNFEENDPQVGELNRLTGNSMKHWREWSPRELDDDEFDFEQSPLVSAIKAHVRDPQKHKSLVRRKDSPTEKGSLKIEKGKQTDVNKPENKTKKSNDTSYIGALNRSFVKFKQNIFKQSKSSDAIPEKKSKNVTSAQHTINR